MPGTAAAVFGCSDLTSYERVKEGNILNKFLRCYKVKSNINIARNTYKIWGVLANKLFGIIGLINEKNKEFKRESQEQ